VQNDLTRQPASWCHGIGSHEPKVLLG
jgi:hypothetical protein